MKDIIYKLQQLPSAIWLAILGWKEFVWDVDLDSYVCCDGRSVVNPCGCMGTTHRQEIEHMRKK